MRIEVKGRNLPVSEDLREHVAKRFRKVERQVSELAELEVEVFEERNPAIADDQVAEATLHLKGVTLRARDASPDILHSINLCADELHVQVKRHRDKRRKRREARAAAAQNAGGGPSVEAVEEAGVAELEVDAGDALGGAAGAADSAHQTGVSSAA
jgi:putative sigma-54 modulation protein